MAQEGNGGLKLFNFVFEAQLNFVEIAISFDCSLQIIWKRGTQKIQTETPVKLEQNQGRAIFNEILKMNSTMYFDDSKQQFLEKKSQFTIVIITEKGNKIAGQCTVDLASYVINQINQQEETLPLQKCPDQNAQLNFIMRVKYIGEGAAAEIPVQIESTTGIVNKQQSKLSQQIDLVTKSAISRKNVLDNEVQQISNGNNESNEKMKLIEKENSKLRKENNDLLKSLQKLGGEQDQNFMEGLEAKYVQQSAQLLQYEGELKTYKQQVSKQDEQIKQLINENNQLKNQLQSHPQNNEVQQSETQQFKMELQMLQDENQKLKKMLELLKTNSGTTEEKYEIEVTEFDGLIENVNQLQEETERQQQTIEKFQKYKNLAQVKLSDYMKEIAGLQEQLVKNKQIIGDAINFVAANSNQDFLNEMMKQIKLS